MRVWACLIAALMVSVEGQFADFSAQEGVEVCICQPVNQRCPIRIPPRGVDTRIVNNSTLGVCGLDKLCCYIDGTVKPTTDTPSELCGIQNPIPYRQAAPSEATFGEYPWMAVLLGAGDVQKGGGVLIGEEWVLTAAHKVKNERGLKVRLGEHDLRSSQDHPTLNQVDLPVSQVVIHPQFNAKSLKNDVALLRLQYPVNTRQYPHIGIACLPDQDQLFDSREPCWVTGFGKDSFEGGQFQVILKEVDVPIVDHAVCQDRLRNSKLTEHFVLDRFSFLCAGGLAGKDACTGDGGAPLMCKVDNEGWTVVGLVAWGIGCAQQDVPGVYVNVPNFRNYIREVTGI